MNSRKIILLISIAANFGLVGYLLYTTAFFHVSHISILGDALQKKSDVSHNVAILIPASHPALEQIQKGFGEVLTKQGTHGYN